MRRWQVCTRNDAGPYTDDNEPSRVVIRVFVYVVIFLSVDNQDIGIGTDTGIGADTDI